jgi:hypothetical protein
MIDCAACIMGLWGTRPVVVEIDGELYALHPACLTPSRGRRNDTRPLTKAELLELEQSRRGYDRVSG